MECWNIGILELQKNIFEPFHIIPPFQYSIIPVLRRGSYEEAFGWNSDGKR
jgi:hypothetical protein